MGCIIFIATDNVTESIVYKRRQCSNATQKMPDKEYMLRRIAKRDIHSYRLL